MKKAVYAFSGDPITYGHLDIIQKAAQVFDQVIVAIGKNPAKKHLFDSDERLAMTKASLKHYPNLKIESFSGMLSDFAYEQQASHVIRGLRNSEDFNYEMILHQVNQSQKLGIETFFIPCSQDKTHISSGAVKAIQLEQGMIHEYVPLNVKKALEAKISKQFILGVTGPIGSGKSTYCKQRVLFEQSMRNEAHHINLDALAHELLNDRSEPIYRQLRKDVISTFGKDMAQRDGSVNRKRLGELIFDDANNRQTLNQMMRNPLITLLRKKIRGLTGLLLIESALLIEADLTFISNNEVVILDVEREEQQRRLIARGYQESQIIKRIKGQWSYKEKLRKLNERIERDGFGEVLTARET